MSIKDSLPQLDNAELSDVIMGILAKAVDGTRKPLLVDENNQRVIVGGTASAGSGSGFQVQGGNMEITSSGKGLILPDANGSGKRCLIEARRDANGNWVLDPHDTP